MFNAWIPLFMLKVYHFVLKQIPMFACWTVFDVIGAIIVWKRLKSSDHQSQLQP
jgi:hypothetical protein